MSLPPLPERVNTIPRRFSQALAQIIAYECNLLNSCALGRIRPNSQYSLYKFYQYNRKDNATMSNILRHSQAWTTDITVLRSGGFDVVALEPQHLAVQTLLKRDLRWTLRLARILPLGLRSGQHQVARKAVAQLIASQRANVCASLPELMADSFSPLAKAGALDLLNMSIVPFVDKFMSLLGGFDIDPVATSQTSSIFDPACSPATRLRLEDAARVTFERAMTAFPDADAQEIDRRVALVVMGRDALLGTIASSLHAHFQAHIGTPLRHVPFPQCPLGTGVPYVWRQQNSPATPAPAGLSRNRIVEVRLDAFCAANPTDRMKLFGVGPHSCVGKAISIDAFDALGRMLGNMPTRVTGSEMELNARHVLAVPSKLRVILE